MPEGGIYLCKRIYKKRQYFLTLQDNKNITSEGADLSECMEDISMQILEWNGDGEAVLELFPEQNKKGATGATVFRTLSYNDSVDIVKGFDGFNEGTCKLCMYGLGGRNANPLEVKWKPEGLVCGVSRIYPSTRLYSQKPIDVLSDEERATFETRPVLFDGKETGYFEAFPEVVIPYVGHKGAVYPDTFTQSWKCSECGRKEFYVELKPYSYSTTFIDAKHLAGDIPSLAFVKTSRSVAMSLRKDRWAELRESKKVKGMLSDPVVALDAEHIEMPELNKPEKFDWIS